MVGWLGSLQNMGSEEPKASLTDWVPAAPLLTDTEHGQTVNCAAGHRRTQAVSEQAWNPDPAKISAWAQDWKGQF